MMVFLNRILAYSVLFYVIEPIYLRPTAGQGPPPTMRGLGLQFPRGPSAQWDRRTYH